jgi:hypothetical protein
MYRALLSQSTAFVAPRLNFILQSKYTRVGLLVPRCNCGCSEPEGNRGADLTFEFEFKKKPQSVDRMKHLDHASARSLHVRLRHQHQEISGRSPRRREMKASQKKTTPEGGSA